MLVYCCETMALSDGNCPIDILCRVWQPDPFVNPNSSIVTAALCRTVTLNTGKSQVHFAVYCVQLCGCARYYRLAVTKLEEIKWIFFFFNNWAYKQTAPTLNVRTVYSKYFVLMIFLTGKEGLKKIWKYILIYFFKYFHNKHCTKPQW